MDYDHLSVSLLHHCQPNQTKCSSEFKNARLLVLNRSQKKQSGPNLPQR